MNKGIVPVLQTPFHRDQSIDLPSLGCLIEDAIAAGAAGFLAPAVASEVEYLSSEERQELVSYVARTIAGRVPFIAGASAESPKACNQFAKLAGSASADACLVAIPERLYACPDKILLFLQRAVEDVSLPLIVQDLQWNGPGLTLDTIEALCRSLPTLIGLKIETVPSGPKYTAVRQAFGDSFYIAGGWAVPQMIEAFDRGIDAMMPQASMLWVDVAVLRLHAAGQRSEALSLFRKLLPILSFANQEITTSIAFFKALLVRRKIFSEETIRRPGFCWDIWNRRIAEELIDLYLTVEKEAKALRLTIPSH